jgi:DNA-binding response OmpR family regulator
MSKDAALVVLHRPTGRQEWPLAEETVIGRDPACDISLADRLVSRRHAVIRRTADGFVAADLGSKNGTWLNGAPLGAPARLADGDQLSIAARFTLYFVDSEATAPLVFDARGLRVDLESRAVFVNGAALEPALSVPQFELLLALYEAAGQAVGRDLLVRRVWPYDEGSGVTDQALDALVRRVRVRLAELDGEHEYISTVRGFGYRFQAL